MEAERKRVANELRSTGGAESEKIRADADKQREVILAEAYREAQRIKGEGDAKASATYARAYEINPEFLRVLPQSRGLSCQFQEPERYLVLEPNSEFFRYLKSGGKPGGK